MALLTFALGGSVVHAQSAAAVAPASAGSAGASQSGVTQQSIGYWLDRLHQASRNRAYVGTFVFSNGTEIASSKIWHVCDGRQQFERIEALTGAPRITMRRNDEVAIFLPAQKLVHKDRREALRQFPDLLRAPNRRIEAFYTARVVGTERVAGLEATVVDFVAGDGLRFGYRIWSEQRTGLMLKMQTRNPQGRVLEQVAFTELLLDAPVRMEQLARQFEQTSGYRVVHPVQRPSTAQEQGWRLRSEVPGFQAMGLHLRQDTQAAPMAQWIFSDGLASVSLFIETFNPQRHTREAVLAEGATHSVSRRVAEHWVTAMGEVPPETLLLHIQALERMR
ncbi:negative regulator of sigma E activity [Serpentinimonas raichei]|uniref:Negative regulator of sigma E activity n=2 Tax=Serpentinimonas raichei TaxID=1458425 RepID=A0A060NRN3_9BURK|nr:negative regulator of sigma E activity [Serpentinimonas raichei]